MNGDSDSADSNASENPDLIVLQALEDLNDPEFCKKFVLDESQSDLNASLALVWKAEENISK